MSRKLAALLPFAAALLLTGCLATPYGELGPWGGGVTSTRLDERRVSVFAKGNSRTELVTLRNYIIRRAAEDTIKAGYTAFEILNAEGEIRTGYYVSSGSSSYSCGKRGCASYYTPAQTVAVQNPVMQADVYMSDEKKPRNPANAFFIAADVLKFMAAPQPASSPPETAAK
ncbi:hypothetical protein M2352_003482 [Azospirillum fermentarium]|uniref:CC0125/CC1285 family lipoprotein n=1 Tax=Azospirillum fermentarium TaxID=1233114 RepID=UPI0022275623|nr:hypothetical protein [Azospirillum fermentarium]MCW2247848.1 hypothetical protein [Azospirillum fermentarium]